MRKKSIFSLLVLMTITLTCAGDEESQNYVSDRQITGGVADWEELAVLGLGVLTANVAYSPDGSHLAVGTSRGVEIWNTASWQMEQWLLVPRGRVLSVSWSPDSQRIAAGASEPENTIKIWEVATGGEVMTLAGHRLRVAAVAWSPDGRKIASAEGTLKIWNAETGQLLVESEVPSATAITWSPDSRKIAASSDLAINVSDAETGRFVWGVPLGYQPFTVSWSPTRNLLAVGGRIARIFDLDDGRLSGSLEGQAGALSLAWSRDGSLLATGSEDRGDRIIKVWDVERRTVLFTLRGHSGDITSLSWSPDGSRIASNSNDRGNSDNTVKIWDVRNSRLWRNLAPDERAGIIPSLSWSPDGTKIAFGSADGAGHVKIWDLETGAFVRNLDSNSVLPVAWSPDGRKIASGCCPMKIWEAATGRELISSPRTGNLVSWSPDSTRIVANEFNGGRLSIWNAENGRELLTLTGHRIRTESVAWSPQGSLIASAGYYYTLRIWHAETGQELMNIPNAGPRLAWSPEGSLIATNGVNGLRFWDLETGQSVKTIQAPGYIVWSPAGSKMLTYGNDLNSITIWDVETCRALRTITTGQFGIGSVIWSPDGSLIASGSNDGTIKIYGARPSGSE